MKKFSLGALVAAGLLMGGLTAGSASAADLGGNCCADLEERIAELEATTARKGNRKVSLTISGWVGEQVMWWDDGAARGTYVEGLGTTLSSHVKFTGQATISPGWYAGYVLQLETDYADPLANLDQDHSMGPGATAGQVVGAVSVLQSYWFVKSDKLGKASVGLISPAADNAAILVDGSGSLVPANWVAFDQNHFFLRVKGAENNGYGDRTARWSDTGWCNILGAGIGGDCVSNPWNVVRYDSPVFAGFSVSADWGKSTYWDAYARYAGEWNGIKVAATSGWSEVNCPLADQGTGPILGGDGNLGVRATCGGGIGIDSDFTATNGHPVDMGVGYWQSGLYIEHVATGLWVLGNYGREFLPTDFNSLAHPEGPGEALTPFNTEPDHWYLKAGVRERWTSLGHTVLFGEWDRRQDMLNSEHLSFGFDTFSGKCAAGFEDCRVNKSRTDQWGLGVVQEIDAAAMSMWLVYRHFDGEFTATDTDDGTSAKFKIEPMQIIKFGALINF